MRGKGPASARFAIAGSGNVREKAYLCNGGRGPTGPHRHSQPLSPSSMNFIFDFDGTLMDTSAVILATIKKTIGDMGLPALSDAECRSIIGVRTDEAASRLYPGLGVSDRDFAAAFRSNYDLLKRGAHEQAFPGVIDTLARLRLQGCGLAIASSRRLASLCGYLDGLGIRQWFGAIVGADSVDKGKPDPAPALAVLNSLGWEAASTMVVGDADVDIMMGAAAGCLTCAVTYGNGEITALKAAAPDYMADAFADILALTNL